MCGIFGIVGNRPIHEALYQGMIKLQHRGQHAAGVFTYDPFSGKHELKRSLGLVHEVFHPHHSFCNKALWGIGHIRYATVGKGCVEDSQPQTTVHGNHLIALAHNGNLVNYVPLKQELQSRLAIIQTSCDIELILHMLAESLPHGSIDFDGICLAVQNIFKSASGAYSVVGMITGLGMIAFRDPQGIRPLLYGSQPSANSHAFASETEALSFLNFQNIQTIKPGEVVFIDMHKNIHRRQLIEKPHFHCSFEFVYFANTSTTMENQEIYRIRSSLGHALAKHIVKANLQADVIVAVPESARPAAINLARTLNIPLEEGLIKKPHIGRTFITTTQGAREKAVSHKLEAVPYVFKNKNVILVDDSIVRGTVSKKAVALARRAGAKKVYFASTYPPILYPCFYGIDFPHRDQLVAYGKSMEEVAKAIDADAVIYNDLQDLKQAIGIEDLCTACMTGKYPATEGADAFQNLRLEEISQMEATVPCQH